MTSRIQAKLYGPGPLTPAEIVYIYSSCYEYWKAGRCPCCGMEVYDDDPVIGEGVRLCMLCKIRKHHEDIEHVERLLLAIAAGAEDARKDR